MNRLIKASLILVCTIVTNQAYSWGLSDLDPTNKNSAIRKQAKDLDPTNPNGSMGKDLHAKINVCNETQGTISYNVSGTEAGIQSGYCDDWTTQGQAVVSFAYMYGSGRPKRYTVNDGNYAFRQSTQCCIDLYQK